MSVEWAHLEEISDIPQHWADRVKNQIFRISPLSKKDANTRLLAQTVRHTSASTYSIDLTNGMTPFRLCWTQDKVKSPRQ